MIEKKLLLLVVISFYSCTSHDIAPTDTKIFKYDLTSGTCKNCKGEIGFNSVKFVEIRKTKNAECLRLSKVELLLLMGDNVQIPNRFAYSHLTNYDFKGSVLDSC